MECHDLRLLLAFAQRPCEQLDAVEREAVAQHLHSCPDCAALAQAEREVDEVFGQAMRDVAVPAELKQNLMKRLTTQPRRGPWQQVAAAAAVLLALSGALAWHFWPAPALNIPDIEHLVSLGNMNEGQVEQHFADQGLPVTVPRDFDYRFLQHVDVVEFKGRRIAKLTFSWIDNERTALANVWIVSPQQFQTDDLPERDMPGTTSVRIRHKDNFTYVIFYRGDLSSLLRGLS